jgi:hypothetical protein
MCRPFSFAGPQPKQALFGAYVSWMLFSVEFIVLKCLAPLRLGVRKHLTQRRKDAKSGAGTSSPQLLSQLKPLHFSRRSVRQFRNKNVTARLLEPRQGALAKHAE